MCAAPFVLCVGSQIYLTRKLFFWWIKIWYLFKNRTRL